MVPEGRSSERNHQILMNKPLREGPGGGQFSKLFAEHPPPRDGPRGKEFRKRSPDFAEQPSPGGSRRRVVQQILLNNPPWEDPEGCSSAIVAEQWGETWADRCVVWMADLWVRTANLRFSEQPRPGVSCTSFFGDTQVPMGAPACWRRWSMLSDGQC